MTSDRLKKDLGLKTAVLAVLETAAKIESGRERKCSNKMIDGTFGDTFLALVPAP